MKSTNPKSTGPGKFFVKVDKTVEVVRAWLFNFDVDGATLKFPEHTNLLKQAIGPVIRDGGSIKLLGLASTTGTAEHDKQLGDRRMKEVENFRIHFGNRFKVHESRFGGKQMALAFGDAHLKGGTRDNTESELWRAVVINAWNRGVPPPPPLPNDVPFANSTWANDVNKVMDVLSGSLGIIDTIADIFDIAGVAAVTGPGGLIVGAVGQILALPLIFATADALANTNGQIQGAADAIQDMADQFGGDDLDRIPLSKWPAVKVPTTHVPDNPRPNVSQEAWRAGQAIGLRNAVERVLKLEQNPKPVTLPDGKNIRINGRIWLRSISKAFKDNAGVEVVIKPANEDLKKRKMPPFPTF